MHYFVAALIVAAIAAGAYFFYKASEKAGKPTVGPAELANKLAGGQADAGSEPSKDHGKSEDHKK